MTTMAMMLLTILISLAMHLLQGGGQMPWRTIGANPDDDNNDNDDDNNDNDDDNNDSSFHQKHLLSYKMNSFAIHHRKLNCQPGCNQI